MPSSSWFSYMVTTVLPVLHAEAPEYVQDVSEKEHKQEQDVGEGTEHIPAKLSTETEHEHDIVSHDRSEGQSRDSQENGILDEAASDESSSPAQATQQHNNSGEDTPDVDGGESDKEKEKDEGDEEEKTDEEEEEEETLDPKVKFEQICVETKCKKYKHHYDECAERVTSKIEADGKSDENCVEEFFDLVHCSSACASQKVWKALK